MQSTLVVGPFTPDLPLSAHQLARIVTVSRRFRSLLKRSRLNYRDIVAEEVGKEVLAGFSHADQEELTNNATRLLNTIKVEDIISRGIRIGYDPLHSNPFHVLSVVIGFVTIMHCIKIETADAKESKRERLDAYA